MSKLNFHICSSEKISMDIRVEKFVNNFRELIFIDGKVSKIFILNFSFKKTMVAQRRADSK